MKRFIFGTALLLLSSGVLSSCNSGEKGNEVPTLDLYGEINSPSCNHLDQIDWKLKEIRLELTDSTTLSDMIVLKTNDNHVWVENHVEIFRFSTDTGKCESIFSRRGAGPEEYYSMLDAAVTDSGEIAVNDFETHHILLYNPDGSFITRSSGKFGDFEPLGDNFIALSFPGTCEAGTMAYKLNSRLQPVDSVVVSPNRETSKGFITLLPVTRMNGKPCLQLRDTIFSFDNMHDRKPLVALNTGSLHLPEEIEDDFNRRAERSQYINGMSAICWKSLVFVKYYYGENAYRDIWDKDSGKLIYRSKDPMAYGFPIERADGTTVNVWPQYSDENQLVGLIPSNSEDPEEEANPGVFMISLK